MKKLLKQLQRADISSVSGMKSELSMKTKRTTLKTLSDCEDWLRGNSSHSVCMVFLDGSEFNLYSQS